MNGLEVVLWGVLCTICNASMKIKREWNSVIKWYIIEWGGWAYALRPPWVMNTRL